MGHEFIELHKCAWIEEKVDSFAGCEFSGFVLAVNSLLSATELSLLIEFLKFLVIRMHLLP